MKKAIVNLTLAALAISIPVLSYSQIDDVDTDYFTVNNKKVVRNYDNSRALLFSELLSGSELYTGCKLTNTGSIVYRGCQWKPRMVNSQSKDPVPQADHVIPASWKYKTLNCGDGDNPREACLKVDRDYRLFYTDLHNLVLTIPQVNNDKSDRGWCDNSGGFEYGKTGFKVDLKKVNKTPIGIDVGCVTPPARIKGDIARIALYVDDTYNLEIPSLSLLMFRRWSASDPVDAQERQRNAIITKLQGNSNKFVR